MRDQVCLGTTENNLCISDFLFLTAYEMSENPFKDVEFDGIIGLGFPDLSMSCESNFLDALLKSNKISNKIFSFYFRNNMHVFDDNQIDDLGSEESIKGKNIDSKLSELSIGGIDFHRINSKVNFTNVISRKYWEIKLDNIYYGNFKFPFCESKNCSAIVDTGTSSIGGSKLFHETIKNIVRLEKDCKNINVLKTITFEIDGIFYELNPKEYSIKIKEKENKKGFDYIIPDGNIDEK